MAELHDIQEAILNAWFRIDDTGFMNWDRGLNTVAWQERLQEANRQLRRAARSLTRESNFGAYGELPSVDKEKLWKSILAARNIPVGVNIISRLGGRYRGMVADVRHAEDILTHRSNDFTMIELHRMRQQIINACPSRRATVERAATDAGDPPPRNIPSSDVRRYQEIMLRAFGCSQRMEAIGTRDAMIEAFANTFLPTVDTGMCTEYIRDQAAEAVMGGATANYVSLALNSVVAVGDMVDAYQLQTNDEYRLNRCVFQACLQETNNNAIAANALARGLQRTVRLLNDWSEWLQRHQNHPAYQGSEQRWDESTTASFNSLEHTRVGSINRIGPVRGSVRGAEARGVTGSFA